MKDNPSHSRHIKRHSSLPTLYKTKCRNRDYKPISL
nr:MAG TPA: hypothetical protein [Caudoviricetes sp.]